MGYGVVPERSDHESVFTRRQSHSKETLYLVATEGWGTTIRYGLLLLVLRGSGVAGGCLAFVIARHFGWS